MKIRFNERVTFVGKQLKEIRSSRETSLRRVREGPSSSGLDTTCDHSAVFSRCIVFNGNTDRDSKMSVHHVQEL